MQVFGQMKVAGYETKERSGCESQILGVEEEALLILAISDFVLRMKLEVATAKTQSVCVLTSPVGNLHA